MNKIKAKLNSKRGVSIVMALLLALVCLFAGAAALTAASANIGRYKYLREDNQDYLSISSAARLLSEQFTKDGNKISADCSSGAAVISYNSFPTGGHVYKLLETNLMKPLLLQCYNNSTSGASFSPLPTSEFTVEADGFSKVYVMVMPTTKDSSKAELLVELYTLEKDKPDHKRNLKFTVELTFDVTPDDGRITVSKAEVECITLPAK